MRFRVSPPLLASFTLASCLALPLAAVDQPRNWPSDPFLPLTAERVASSLPAAEQGAWLRYLDQSKAAGAQLPPRTAPEPALNKPMDTPPAGGVHSRGLKLGAKADWFRSREAQEIADRVVQAQTRIGGWTKGYDYTRPIPKEIPAHSDVWSGGTFDNDATTWEMRMLARTNAAAADAARGAAWRDSFLKGLGYLLAAQYPNGGFPQIYPLAGGYHDAITYNDEAMAQVLELLRDVAARKAEFSFVPEELAARCGEAMQRGLQCVLASQIKDGSGQLTVWCQQHDALTLKPCAARNFEPVALCSDESGALLRFLMSLPKPSPEVVRSVDAAIAWLKANALHDVTWSRFENMKELKAQPGAPLLWARFYEPETNKPIFGDRDRTIHYAVNEISSERRRGYAWYGTWPQPVLDAYPAWVKRVKG